MDNESGFDFDTALDIQPIYQPSERFLEAFYIFGYRIGSLQRYYVFGNRYIERYLAQSQTSLRKIRDHFNSAEEAMGKDRLWAVEMVHSDFTSSDKDYFADYLRGSVISHLFTLIEGLLADVADDLATMLDQKMEFPNKPMPYINRYVTYLQRSCGLSLNIDKETWRRIDAIREIRNRYVHRLNHDLPEQIQLQMQRLIEAAKEPDTPVDNLFVQIAFSTIGKLAADLERAYWSFVDSQEVHKPEGE